MSDTSCYVERFKACVEASPMSAMVNEDKLCKLMVELTDEACARLQAENKVLREWIESEKREAARLRGDSK